MLYKIRDSVAANTTELTAETKKLAVTQGIIRQWFIFAPLEGANLLKVKVLFHGHQLIPYNREEYILPATFNNQPIDEYFELSGHPYELEIKAWNEDTAKAHEYNIHVNVVPEELFTMQVTSPGLLDHIRSFFGGG